MFKAELEENKHDQMNFKYDSEFKISDIVSHCYGLDENVEPNIYRLKDLNLIILKHLGEEKAKNINNKYIKDCWVKLEAKLIELFQYAADKCYKLKQISKEEKYELYRSGRTLFFCFLFFYLLKKF